MNNMLNVIMSMLQNGNNPQALIDNIVQTNPQMQVLFNQVKQSGMTPEQFVMQYAKQNNVNVMPLVNMLKNRGIK